MKRLGLFEGYGVELEYMIVDSTTLAVRPVADEVLKQVTGDYSGDADRGKIAWSNELVNHVIELKTNGPAENLIDLPVLFQDEIHFLNSLLHPMGAMLLPTASHPFMDPHRETVLWAHENNEIYQLYNRIFDCSGHGWSNVQSTHINLPFSGDEEFGRLHAAIRVILPILPALSASSPVLDGRITGFHDTRLDNYRKNQARIPSICGAVIPERVYTERDYHAQIFDVIMEDVRPWDTEGILKKYFLNSRGAIARFDRGAIEIRLLDIQECPRADLAILELVVAAIRKFCDPAFHHIRQWKEENLRDILLAVIRDGEEARIESPEFLDLFGLHDPVRAGDCWAGIANEHDLHFKREINHILTHGSLSTRILRSLPADPTHNDLVSVYKRLAECLGEDQLFKP